MHSEGIEDMSLDISVDRLAGLKSLKERIRLANSKMMPTVTSNGEILSGLIGNASDFEMDN